MDLSTQNNDEGTHGPQQRAIEGYLVAILVVYKFIYSQFYFEPV